MSAAARAPADSAPGTVIRAVLVGVAVMLAGTLPRNFLFAANLRHHPEIPWAIPLIAAYLWLFWRYLDGAGPPAATSAARREALRARRVGARGWAWSLLAGGLGIVALVLALHVANRLVALPPQTLPDLAQVPATTVLALLVAAAPIAGVVEEAAFRGYMQGPIERRLGLTTAILVTGTMFALSHLDFTPILWPYYVAVAALYGAITHLTRSILPAIVLHTAGNLYSNTDLWRHGRAEWQAAAHAQASVWAAGTDASFWIAVVAGAAFALAAVFAFRGLARAMNPSPAASA